MNYEYHCCYFLVLLPNLLAIIVSVNMKVSSANIVVNILAITSVFLIMIISTLMLILLRRRLLLFVLTTVVL